MKLFAGAGNLNTYTVIGVVSACAAPALALNVWPRIEAMLTNGITSNEVGIALLVTVSALGMTSVPFAMKKAESWGFWAVCLAFGLGLAVFNYIMAVGAIGKVSDHATDAKASAIHRAITLKERIEELKASRRELGSFKPTTEAMLRAADEAVKLAEDARKQECDKVGDFCRARVAQLSTRLSERAEIAGALSLSRRGAEIDSRRSALDRELAELGPLPRSSDPQAERIKGLLQFFGAGSFATDAVATGIIHFTAILAELFALGMPRIIVTALARPAGMPHRGGLLAIAPSPAEIGRPRQRALSAATKRNGAAALAPPGSVRDWAKLSLRPSTEKLVCWTAYKAYERWCRENAQTPTTFTSFDFELSELGVKKVSEGRGSFYVEVGL